MLPNIMDPMDRSSRRNAEFEDYTAILNAWQKLTKQIYNPYAQELRTSCS